MNARFSHMSLEELKQMLSAQVRIGIDNQGPGDAEWVKSITNEIAERGKKLRIS
jgi:hypothetical protein